jgi:hypothetical protein
MTSLADAELIRARWRRTLDRHGLDDVRRSDFGGVGLATRLESPTVQALLLPADPEQDALSFDEEFWEWFQGEQDTTVDGRGVRFGYQKRPTAHAAVFVDDHGRDGAWRRFLGIHRSGAVEMGLGSSGGREYQDDQGETVRIFALTSIVAYTWAMLNITIELQGRVDLPTPWQLTLGLISTKGALLGNVAEGWAEPGSWNNSVGGCADENLLWHFELDQIPNQDLQQDLAFAIGDRIEDAWGVTQRRYLARQGERVGQLDHRRIME